MRTVLGGLWTFLLLVLSIRGEGNGRGKRHHRRKGGDGDKALQPQQQQQQDQDGDGGSDPAAQVPQHRRRIAVLWTFNRELPATFELSLATLVNAGADMVDVHVLAPDIPEIYVNGSNPHYSSMQRVFFHTITAQDWRKRVNASLGIELPYDLGQTHRKTADLKPMMGLLFQDLIPEAEYAFWVYGDSDGLFGSYNRLLDPAVLPYYDVVSGFPVPTGSVQVLAGRPLRCTGAWTMWRNSPRINNLFRRAINWRSMVLHGDLVYAFDEHSRPMQAGEEDMHMVLESSSDVRQCCLSSSQPHAKLGANTAFLAEMTARFLEVENGSVTIGWRRGQGVTVTVDGHFGFGEAYKREAVEPLFLHFLEWKYSAGAELNAALSAVLARLKSEGKSPFDMDCLEVVGTFRRKISARLC